jgi:hypothetical protein
MNVWGLAASGGTSSDTSVAGSVGINVIILTNEAKVGQDATLRSDPGGITMDATAPVGMQNLAISGALGDTAVGVAVAVNIFDVTTTAHIDSGATLNATGNISVTADASLDPMDVFDDDIPVLGNITVSSIAVGGAVSTDSNGIAVGGSALVDILTLTTQAWIGDDASINQNVARRAGPRSAPTTTPRSLTARRPRHAGNAGACGVVDVIVKDVRPTLGFGATPASTGRS